MEQVAERAGVSRALVSIVMRDKPGASPQSRARVRAAARELGYSPNLSAQSLARGRSDTIGIMANDLANPFFTEMAGGVAAAAERHGLRIVVNSGWGSPAGEQEAIELLVSLRVDGIVLGSPRLDTELQAAFARRIPVVAINTYGRPADMDTVCNDEHRGAALVVDHLAELGHRRIAHISADSASAGPERRSAFVNAMENRDLLPVVVGGDFTEDAGWQATAELMSGPEPPTAILATNDLAGVGVLGCLAELGVDVPGDVSVVGYDDTMLAGIRMISLTTVHQPRHLIGRRALELLHDRIAGRHEAIHELVQPTLVARRTTGPAPVGVVT